MNEFKNQPTPHFCPAFLVLSSPSVTSFIALRHVSEPSIHLWAIGNMLFD